MKKYQKVQRVASSGTANFASCNGEQPPHGYCGSIYNYRAR